MITVACVLKAGGDFGPAYVERLELGVDRHLALPHRFVCLTDLPAETFRDDSEGQVIPLTENWPGWWSKMELFKLPGPVLFFDLDTVITGPIDALAEWICRSDGALVMLSDFYRPKQRSSGILGWRGNTTKLFKCFWTGAELFMGKFRGDQEYLRAHLSEHPEIRIAVAQDIFPGIKSFKVDVRGRQLPADAKVICFHGRPRPHEVRPLPDWMQECWVGNETINTGRRNK